jgi:HEAT repeat protein
MAAGLLEEPGALIDSLLRWASDGPLKIASNSSRIELTEPLVDCLYECQSGKVSPASLNLAWQLFARTLETIQRQRGRDNDEWRQLVDWSLTYRILHAAKIHEGVQAQTDPLELEAVLEKLRHTEGGNMVEDPAQVVESIRTSMTSGCAPVRWASIWAIGALKEKKWKMNESKLRELLKPLLDFIETAFHSDLDIHVRAIAGRALVKTKHPDAFQMLVKRLNECDAEDTAGAAIAISGFGTEEAVIALKGRAERALSESPGDARNIILGAVIGSLDAVVKKMKETADRFALRDTLMRALESPSIVARASAASALGNLHVLEAWPVLARILEAPRIAETEALRGPSSWAAQQLAPLLNEPIERARATRIFRGILADRSELPNVRKPAASALGTFFKKERPEIPVLQLLQREAQDPAVATACLIALCRARTTEAYPYLILLLKQDIDIRSQFCDAAANQPSALALNAVLWLLDNDKRPEIQKGAFNAISKAAEQAKDRAVLEAENYGTDTKLLFLLAKMCVTNIRSKHAESVQSSMFALWGLAKLPTFKSGGAISLLLKSSLTSVRELAESSSPSMQESAAFLLGAIGERSDIALIRRLGIETKDRRLQGAFHSSAHFLSRRLDNEAHRGNLS